MGRSTVDEEGQETLRGKYRFRAVVRKVLMNLAWLTEPVEELEEETDEQRMAHAVLRAKSRRRREGSLSFSLEEKMLFSLPREFRDENKMEKLLISVKGIKTFSNYSEEVQQGLAETLYFIYLTEHRTVLREGQEPQAMYFILQGDVLITVTKEDPYSKELYQQPLAVLTAGDMFGEVALLYNCGRTATVTTSSVVELLGLQRDDFEVVLRKTLEAQWHRFRTEISRFSYFDNWNETQVREMCILGRLRAFNKDDTILGDGCGTQEYAYFVLSGSCRLVQTITVEVWEEFGDTVYRLLDDPSLAAVRELPSAKDIKAGDRGPDVSAEQLAAQDEWKLAALRVEAVIGYPAASAQWRSARAELERVLKREEPFKYKTIVHPEQWDIARQCVITTLGEHTTRGARRSRSTEQLYKLYGRSATGAPPSPAARRMSTLPGMSGRKLGLPSFVGRPSVFMGLSRGDSEEEAGGPGSGTGGGWGAHAEAITALVARASQQMGMSGGSVEALQAARLSGVVTSGGAGGSGSAEGEQAMPRGSRKTPLQLELVRGRRRSRSRGTRGTRGARSTRGTRPHSGTDVSFSSRDQEGEIVGFASDSERHQVIKMRHAFEDPFERTPRPRRMSLTSRSSIHGAWISAVRAVADCLNACEERTAGGTDDVDDMRAAWRRVCRGVERFMKKEQVPVMRPRHRISCHFVQVCFYTPLQVFGIGESMEQRRVTALTPVECMLLPRYWLEQNNVANVWERVRLYLNRSIPDTRAVFRAWAAERRWLRHRQHVVAQLIDRRRLDSGTTPYDVPYALRLQDIAQPHALGYKRRYVIRENPASSQRKPSRTSGKAVKLSKPLMR